MTDLHLLSAQGFLKYVEGWSSESPDDCSLSKYSISLLFKQAGKLLEPASKSMGVGFALYLRAAALKREHGGASRFIFWSFADAPPPRDDDVWSHRVRGTSVVVEPLHGIGKPNSAPFQTWITNKSSGADLKVPTWDLPLLADYADEFLHLSNHLESVSKEFDSTFPNQGAKGGVSLAQGLDAFVYFDSAQKLISLARAVLERAVAEHRENPVDLLLQAIEGIGLVTRRSLRSEDVAKSERSSPREAQRSAGKSEERSQPG